jgi:broad specificity phosphatase PhoE
MSDTQFYIARHGETENNRAGRLSGWIDTPLTPDGLIPTARVLAKLHGTHVDVICSSDLGRAFVTAYIMARELGYKEEIMRLPGLREVNYGDAANMRKSEAYTLYPDLDRNTHFTPPEGESLDHMQKRVLETVNMLSERFAGKHVLIVAHSGVMAALHASLTGQDFGKHNITDDYPHDFVARFRVQNGRVASFEELAGNETA